MRYDELPLYAQQCKEKLVKQVYPPKAPVTLAPRLDKVYVDLCSKSTKQADRSLACIQALMLDAAGPISEVLEQLNMTTEDDLEEIELDL